jgi:hypothetical protein
MGALGVSSMLLFLVSPVFACSNVGGETFPEGERGTNTPSRPKTWVAPYTNVSTSDALSVRRAANKYLPSAAWRADSVIFGDFTCSVGKQWAILGTDAIEILIAVFINGPRRKPEVLHYSGSARNASTAALSVEDLDFDPRNEIGYDLPGFQRSKVCKGLNLSDGGVDSAHIYWNRQAKRFDDWSR